MVSWSTVFRASDFTPEASLSPAAFEPLASGSSTDFHVTGFAGVTVAVLVLLLALARDTHSEPDPGSDGAAKSAPRSAGRARPAPAPVEEPSAGQQQDEPTPEPAPEPAGDSPAEPTDDPAGAHQSEPEVEQLSASVLLANVALSHGLLGFMLVGAAILAAVPPAVLGVHVPTQTTVVAGLALGVALYVTSEVGAAVSQRTGFGRDESLRESLAPETLTGWLVLLGGVLPIIAGFEELLFRGALIGAFAVGFDLSPWLLAVLSSVAFGLGHGAQGTSGMIVTGALGFVLAAGFVLTGSLVAVFIAHYVINALEFIVHEGLGLDWTARLAGE